MSKEYVFVGTAQLKTRDYIHQLEKENKELKHKINKALDKLYCWGEVLEPEFQQEMIKILNINEISLEG